VRDPADRLAIEKIADDEWHHREELLAILSDRSLYPWFPLEWIFWLIGTTVGLGCSIWGEWASAYGASKFEVNGVSEYKRLSSLARRIHDEDLALRMEELAEHEREHQEYFSALASANWRGRSPTAEERE
jgi:rubrerythrin